MTGTGGNHTAKVGWTARLAAALALSSALLAGPARAQQSDGARDLIDAFSMDFERAACPARPDAPLIAHLEDVGGVLQRDPEDRKAEFLKHPQMAAQILWDRVNAHRADCLPVYLLDFSFFDGNAAFPALMRAFKIVTISEYKAWVSQADEKAMDKGQPVPAGTPSAASRAMEAKRRPYEKETAIAPGFWETQSDTVIVYATGNDADKPEKLKNDIYYPLHDSNGFIAVGALDDNSRLADYSSRNAPDLVWYTGFSQGFCGRLYATGKEIGKLADLYSLSIVARPSRMAGAMICEGYGDSFGGPDVGGFVARGRADFPGLNNVETAVAAWLATSDHVPDAGTFTPNARNIPFNKAAGHGAFLPGLFNRLMAATDAYKKTGHDAVTGRVTAEAEAHHNKAVVRIDADRTVTRVAGRLAFRLDRGVDPDDEPRQIPDAADVISPAGTHYRVPVRLDCCGQAPGMAFARFSNSAFLGEAMKGNWTVTVPNRHYHLTGVTLSETGVEAKPGNTVDWMIDYAKRYKADYPEAMKVTMDTAPWRPAPLPPRRPPGL